MHQDGPAGTLRLAELYAPIEADLRAARQVIADELICDQAFISDLCRHVEQFHGKMLRPALLLLTAQACGGVRPAHRVLAAVVELVHIATLVHDDVLDESDIRRRAATVNRLWGNERAVLLGDFIYSHAYRLCSTLDTTFAGQLIGQTAVTVCEGEMMQVANRGNYDLTAEQYFEIVSRKTGALVEACCHLGAQYAGADEATIARLREFGMSLGIAFQIADDLLDLTGSEAEVGKSLRRDLCEGEITLAVIHLLGTLNAGERQQTVAQLTGNGPQQCRDLNRVMRQAGSLDFARETAEQYVDRARTALHELPPSPARESLLALAEFATNRSL